MNMQKGQWENVECKDFMTIPADDAVDGTVVEEVFA